MLIFIVGALAVTLAVVLVFFVAAPVRVSANRRSGTPSIKGPERSIFTSTSEYLVSSADRALQNSSRSPVTARDLEVAGINTTAGTALVFVASISIAVGLGVATVAGSLFIGLLLGALVPVGAKFYLSFRVDRRRAAFADQLEETLMIIASSLRAGHSFPAALDAVSHNSLPPTSEEFARIINEHRIGRDQIVAMSQTADRMDSEDFRWVTEAVEVHRETGGNLNEIIDRVAGTIRARRELRLQVNALAAEGKFSALVLMALPIFGGGIFMVLNPSYMSILFTTTVGKVVVSCSVVLYIVGGLWLRKLVNVVL